MVKDNGILISANQLCARGGQGWTEGADLYHVGTGVVKIPGFIIDKV